MPVPANLRQEFATLQKSFLSFMGFFGGQGFVLQNPDRTLQARGGGQGLLLYDRVMEDPHAHAVFQQRKLELIARDWKLEPASDDEADIKAADLVDAQLEALGAREYALANYYGGSGFDGVALNLLEATAKGYGVGEIMWAQDGQEIFVAEVRPKDQRRFGWVLGEAGAWELRLITDASGSRGEPIPDRKFIYHSPTASDANPYGLGLCSKVFWPVFFKRQNIQFWLIFADKFGSPTPVGKYPPGTSEADKAILLEALANLTQGMATTLPEGMLIEFLEATRSGNVTTYEGLARWCDEQISECILGQTGTTNQSDGGGSRARDEVAREGMGAIIKADADLLSRTLDRTLIRWIVELNRPILGEGAKPPQFAWIFEDEDDLTEVATRDKLLFEMGFRRTVESVAEVYGDGYELMEMPSAQSPEPSPPSPLSQGGEGEQEVEEVEMAEGEDDPIGPLLLRLRAQAQPEIVAMVEVVRRELGEAESLEEFNDRLITLFPELESGPLAETLTQAMTAARLTGRYAVQTEIAQEETP
jgi:phage gp29-like protein